MAVSGVGVAKRQGLWAEMQRERAQRQRVRRQEFREFQRAEARAAREAAKAERDRMRQSAADERERKKLYVEDRPVVTFASLKRNDTYPAFDAGRLGRAQPPRAVEQHTAAEADRRRQLAAQRAAYDAAACLKRLNALVSPHPYDLEPVQPTVDFDSLLTQFKFVAGMDVIAGLDSRPDLLAMAPYEFEHLVRQIFEEMGMQAWNTQAIKDDGVDAVAVNNDAVFGGMCIIQAKRYRNAVGVEAVRALAGVMEARHGRIEIMECEHVQYLCKEHLGLDVLISLPKPPPR
jgi:Restriction endonuclease